MIVFPTLAECEKIAAQTGGHPTDAFGPRLVDWIVWDSADGVITYHRLTPESWISADSTCHTVTRLGDDTISGQDLLDLCHEYASLYL